MLGIVDVRRDHHRGEDADGKIDVEDPRPAVVVGEPAAERRADRRPDHDAEPEQRHRRSGFLARERLEQHRLRHGHQRAAAEPCTMRQKMSAPSECDAPQKKLDEREEDDRADEVALASEAGRRAIP